jgi:hypothetical protein
MDRRFESRLDEGTETVRVPVSFPAIGLTPARPPRWTPLVQAPAADTCQLTCSISRVRGDPGACGEEGQRRDRQIAKWPIWLCDNGSVHGRC